MWLSNASCEWARRAGAGRGRTGARARGAWTWSPRRVKLHAWLLLLSTGTVVLRTI